MKRPLEDGPAPRRGTTPIALSSYRRIIIIIIASTRIEEWRCYCRPSADAAACTARQDRHAANYARATAGSIGLADEERTNGRNHSNSPQRPSSCRQRQRWWSILALFLCKSLPVGSSFSPPGKPSFIEHHARIGPHDGRRGADALQRPSSVLLLFKRTAAHPPTSPLVAKSSVARSLPENKDNNDKSDHRTTTTNNNSNNALNRKSALLRAVLATATTTSSSSRSPRRSATSLAGLSRFHLSMVAPLRQRFLTGQESPVIVSFRDNPTLRWLNRASSAQVMVNGTTIEKSFASLDRFMWLDSQEMREAYTVELLAEIKSIPRPAYLQILPDRRLWATGFAVGATAHVTAVDCTTGQTDVMGSGFVPPTAAAALSSSSSSSPQLKWPNELQALDVDTVLVADGFLVPTKDRGGLYIIYQGRTAVCITDPHERWFYHRAVWIQHPDGSTSVLAARCRLTTAHKDPAFRGIAKTGQLVWLNAPESFAGRDFGDQHQPWDMRVLAEGPDVMFAVADLDPTDDTIEVIASEFFSERITLHSIQKDSPTPTVTFRRVIDDSAAVGQAYGCILANLDGSDHAPPQQQRLTTPVVVDSGSTVPCLRRGDAFSHLLVTSHECNTTPTAAAASTTTTGYSNNDEHHESSLNNNKNNNNMQLSRDGGSLFSYQVPVDWRNDPWERTVVASGFKVNGKLSNMINPGAPGFVYTFQPHRHRHEDRPWIAVAGDCAESAYIFRPVVDKNGGRGGGGYRLLLEVQCEATVGSIAIGYDDFGAVDQDSGYAKLYIPCYEQDKILVLGLGGKADEDDSGW